MLHVLFMSLAMIVLFACGEKHGSPQKEIVPISVNSTPVKSEIEVIRENPKTSKTFSDVEMKECCKQCSSASGKDPTGTDISMKSCLAYGGMKINGAALLSEMCVSYFHQSDLKVMDCR